MSVSRRSQIDSSAKRYENRLAAPLEPADQVARKSQVAG
jgi:hypothetical protein